MRKEGQLHGRTQSERNTVSGENTGADLTDYMFSELDTVQITRSSYACYVYKSILKPASS